MNRVKELRIRAGMQQKELALLAGVSRPIVSEWEHGKKNPSGERLRKLSEIFKVDPGTILGYSQQEPFVLDLQRFSSESNRTEISGTIPIQKNAVPIVGEIACGVPITAEQNVTGYADLPDGVHADFALRCKGDSMTPTFIDGDLVLIRQQPEVEPGQIAAVNVNGETTLKHVYPQQGGLLLIADNANFPPIFVPAGQDGEIIIHGLAVGYLRLFE